MVASNTGAAGIAEAASRFGDGAPWVARSGVRFPDARLVIIMAVAAFVPAGGRPAQGAVGDPNALHHAAPDGGAWAGSRGNSPPGAFLGPLAGGVGMTKAGEPDKLYRLTPGANGDLVYEAPQFVAVVAPDGTVTFHDRRIIYSRRRATFSFDLSDEFARELTHGTSSPYAKADFLAATFKRRTAMAANVSSQQMAAAQRELPSRLDALWADTRYRRRERRRIIFLLWRELETADGSGRSAATTIEAWVRKRLPRGSPDAYGDQELAAYFRENQNEPAFSPYGSPLEMRWPPSP